MNDCFTEASKRTLSISKLMHAARGLIPKSHLGFAWCLINILVACLICTLFHIYVTLVAMV